jgi:predicted ABC-type sugar transport system permease subunit
MVTVPVYRLSGVTVKLVDALLIDPLEGPENVKVLGAHRIVRSSTVAVETELPVSRTWMYWSLATVNGAVYDVHEMPELPLLKIVELVR